MTETTDLVCYNDILDNVSRGQHVVLSYDSGERAPLVTVYPEGDCALLRWFNGLPTSELPKISLITTGSGPLLTVISANQPLSLGLIVAALREALWESTILAAAPHLDDIDDMQMSGKELVRALARVSPPTKKTHIGAASKKLLKSIASWLAPDADRPEPLPEAWRVPGQLVIDAIMAINFLASEGTAAAMKKALEALYRAARCVGTKVSWMRNGTSRLSKPALHQVENTALININRAIVSRILVPGDGGRAPLTDN